jgi:Alginate lyase
MKSRMSRLAPDVTLVGILGLTSVLVLGLASAASAGTRPPGPSSSGPSLSGWRLILPVNSSGGRTGDDAAELNPAALDSPWLTRKPGGALNFWAPAIGATTPGSLHARTELVSNEPFILGQGTNTLNEKLAVTKEPTQTKNIIIAQLFEQGGSGAEQPYTMLHYDGGEIYVFTTGVSGDHDLMSGVPLGATFSTSITAAGNDLTFTATYNGKTGTYTIQNTAGFPGNDVEWHAGDYEQDVSQGAAKSDGGRVVMYQLQTSQS